MKSKPKKFDWHLRELVNTIYKHHSIMSRSSNYYYKVFQTVEKMKMIVSMGPGLMEFMEENKYSKIDRI